MHKRSDLLNFKYFKIPKFWFFDSNSNTLTLLFKTFLNFWTSEGLLFVEERNTLTVDELLIKRFFINLFSFRNTSDSKQPNLNISLGSVCFFSFEIKIDPL